MGRKLCGCGKSLRQASLFASVKLGEKSKWGHWDDIHTTYYDDTLVRVSVCGWVSIWERRSHRWYSGIVWALSELIGSYWPLLLLLGEADQMIWRKWKFHLKRQMFKHEQICIQFFFFLPFRRFFLLSFKFFHILLPLLRFSICVFFTSTFVNWNACWLDSTLSIA